MTYESDIEQFIGSTIKEVKGLEIDSYEVCFYTDKGVFKMYHSQDCCESVNLDDIVGVTNLTGAKVYDFIEKTNSDDPKVDPDSPDYHPDSFTWTFYTLVTSKGCTDIKWYGESSGYYSETAEFKKLEGN